MLFSDDTAVPEPPDDQDNDAGLTMQIVMLRAEVMRGERSDWPRHHHLLMQAGEQRELVRIPWRLHVTEVLLAARLWLDAE
jgi:hypothetical protein